jgi:hypothetical protein
MAMEGIQRTAICVLLLASAAAAQSSTPASHLPDAPSTSRRQLRPPAGKSVVAIAPSPTTQSPAERPYKPLTPRQKFNEFLRYSYSPYTMVNVLYSAAYAQATGDPYGYGGGMEGYGKRVGASLASTEGSSFFGTFLFPVILHQDPRYFPMRKGTVVERGWHAASRVLVTRADGGRNTVNTSGLLAIAVNAALKNAYMPAGDRGAAVTFERMAGAAQGMASGYVLEEFMPDILRIFRRHAPDKLKKLEDKIPPQVFTGTPGGAD